MRRSFFKAVFRKRISKRYFRIKNFEIAENVIYSNGAWTRYFDFLKISSILKYLFIHMEDIG